MAKNTGEKETGLEDFVLETQAGNVESSAEETPGDPPAEEEKPTDPPEKPAEEEKPNDPSVEEEKPAEEEKPNDTDTPTDAPAEEEKPSDPPAGEEKPDTEAVADTALKSQLETIMKEQDIDETAALKVVEDNLDTETPEAIAIPELITQLYNELGWKAEDEENTPEPTVAGLKNLLESVVVRNSTPKYGSPEAEAFDKFTAAGGNAKLFWDTTYGTADYSKLTVEDEAGQVKVMSNYLKEQHPDWDADKIHNKVEVLKEKELLEEDASDALPILVRMDADRKAKLVIDKEAIRVSDEGKRKESDLILRTHINSNSKIAGFEVADKEKDRFYEFMTTRDENGKTAYMELLNIEGTRLNLAFLAFRGIDATSLRQDVITDVTTATRKALQRFKATSAGTTSTDAAPEIGKGQDAEANIDAFVLKQ